MTTILVKQNFILFVCRLQQKFKYIFSINFHYNFAQYICFKHFSCSNNLKRLKCVIEAHSSIYRCYKRRIKISSIHSKKMGLKKIYY